VAVAALERASRVRDELLDRIDEVRERDAIVTGWKTLGRGFSADIE
jgi:hypothetical protein